MPFQIDPQLLGLEDEVALVTGGAAGIGRGCALQLARAGCHVAIADIDADAAASTVTEIGALGRKAGGRRGERPRSGAGPVDGRAGDLPPLRPPCGRENVGNPRGLAPFLETTVELWDDMIEQNLRSSFLSCQAEARAMVERGTLGRIITVASSSGVVGAPNIIAYGAARASVIHMTKTLAPHGIRVNCIVPGTHLTERMAANTDPAAVAFREAAGRRRRSAGSAIRSRPAGWPSSSPRSSRRT